MADDTRETLLHRYIDMVKDMQSYLDYTVEMEKLATQMNEHGKQTRAYASLSFQYDTYRVARETYWEKCAERYGVADVESFSRAMHALESEIHRHVAVEQERHQPQPKKPLLDFYTRDAEHSPSEGAPRDTDISDQKLKKWLEERIVRLELYRYELNQIKEQRDAIDQHADYLAHRGGSPCLLMSNSSAKPSKGRTSPNRKRYRESLSQQPRCPSLCRKR